MPAEVERARRLFTRAEYHCMGDAGILKPTERVELIRGEIIEMSPIGARHVAFVNNLNQLLVTRLEGRAIVSVQNPVALDDDTEPEPDLAILRRRRPAPYKESEPVTEDVLLLIEIGDTSSPTTGAPSSVSTPRRASRSTGWWTPPRRSSRSIAGPRPRVTERRGA